MVPSRNQQSSDQAVFQVLALGAPAGTFEVETVELPAGTLDVRYDYLDDTDTFLEALVTGASDLHIIARHREDLEDVLDAIKQITAGAAICLVDLSSERSSAVLEYHVGLPTLKKGQALGLQLPILIATTYERMRRDHEVRAEKDDLIRQLMDLRDQQERIESQSADIIAMAEDLEYSRQTLEKLNVEKDKLFSVIAHDLKSPFTAILGYSELLATTADKLETSQIKEYASSTHLAATNVFKLMQTLLEWARIQIGRVDYAPEKLIVSEVVHTTVDVYQAIAKRKKIEIRVVETDHAVYCDRGMAETVIRNLINNAVKFSPIGGDIVISCTEHADNIEISICNDGIGMTPEQAKNCFDLSSSTHTDGTAGEKGTGLGLSICKEMVEKNGGKIAVESALNGTTRFFFTLQKAPL